MSKWWIGTFDAVLAELKAQHDVSLSAIGMITELSVNESDVDRFIGIARPDKGAHIFTLHPPVGASGDATWRQYDGGWAPECELYAARLP